MKKTDLDYIAGGTGGTLAVRAGSGYVTSAATDSRSVRPGGLFFAIIGARNDGHRFIPGAVKNGCSCAVISDPEWIPVLRESGVAAVLVDDTTKALVRLAKKYMEDWKGLVKVAVTGSVGKTTTKDMLQAVLSCRYLTGKTQGNLNSEYGIPLTVFGFDEDIEAAVIEIGAGEGASVRDLASIVEPDAAVITTVGSSHLELFGTREKLAEEKIGIAAGFGPGNALIVNTDCDMLDPLHVRKYSGAGTKIIKIGTKEDNDYILSDICDMGIDGVKCTLEICAGDRRKLELRLPIVGAHNLFNAAEAIAAGGFFGIDPADAAEALSNAEITGGRLEIERSGGITVINDAYNASPESVKAALKVLKNSRAGRRAAVLGDMFELGSGSDEMHRSVGRAAADAGVDLLVTVGKNSLATAEEARGASAAMEIHSFDTTAEAASEIRGLVREDDVILVKASRAMALEQVVSAILEK
jgi:UDP-N-acetylmuramoyl-tripeptide--D-alanyl-D-alanine ligase